MFTIQRVAASLLLVVASASAGAQRAANQSNEDARWLPWVGCWQRSGDAGGSVQLTCVRPSSGASAEIVAVANGGAESRERIVVDGQPHAIDKDGCSGSQTASWSTSGSRIYIGAAYSCAGGLHGRSTRMFAMLPFGVWLEVRDVHSGGGWVEAVTRFHDAGLPASVPADIRSEISHRELAIATARAAASGPASATDIAEAMRAVDTAVVQSWLAARGQAFAQDSTRVAAAPANLAPVYEGASMPAPAPRPAGEMLETGCDPFGCYAPNGYSNYNGTVFTPYARTYFYGYGPSYYVPYLAPVVVIRGGVTRGRPSVLHTPVGHAPVGHSPVGHSPIGAAPPVHRTPVSQPVNQAPRGGMTGRVRP